MNNKVLFFGRKSFGAKALAWLVDNGWDVVGVVTDTIQRQSPTAKLAKKLGLRLLDYDTLLNDKEEKQIQFDVGVSYVFWRKISPKLITMPSLGFINFHPAPLPDLKGTGGYNIAILEGHSSYGVTAHYVDENIDTGPIIRVKRFQINSAEHTALSLERLSHNKMLKLFKEIMRQVKEKGVLASSYDRGGRYISRHEMENLKDIKPGDDIDRKIRAFWYPPYDGARIEINGKYFTLVNRTIIETLNGDQNALFLDRQLMQNTKKEI